MKVTVFGATGVVGSALLPLLVADHELVAVSRSTHATGQGVRWVEGDANSAGDVARAIEGAEVAYLVHSLGRRDFERQDRVAAENVAAACELARAKQIVYLGGLGDDDPTASPHLRSRRETGERLSAGAVPVTTLRAAMIVGRGSAAFETIVASSTACRR
ncbi:MAG: NAD(P)H-binding protein [Gaiellaceae bacterium]